MSGRLKWANAVNAAMDAQSITKHWHISVGYCWISFLLPIIFPSWFKTFKSTLKFHTFSSAIIHNDSKSMHRESLKARSKIRFTWTLRSLLRFASKFGAAIGPSSTLINRSPSFGLVDFGWATSQVTCANTLVSPRDTCTLPQSDPKCIFIVRNSFRSRPSRRNCRILFNKFNLFCEMVGISECLPVSCSQYLIRSPFHNSTAVLVSLLLEDSILIPTINVGTMSTK